MRFNVGQMLFDFFADSIFGVNFSKILLDQRRVVYVQSAAIDIRRQLIQIGHVILRKLALDRRYVADIDLAVAVCVAENGRGNNSGSTRLKRETENDGTSSAATFSERIRCFLSASHQA